MIKKILLLVLILSLFIAGCQKAAEPKTTDTASESVESSISEIGSLDKELSTDELDSIEKDLDEINW